MRRRLLGVLVVLVACGDPVAEPRIDVLQSTFTVDRVTAEVGTEYVLATIVLRDAAGDPVPGVTVTLDALGTADSVTQPAATDAAGTTTGTWSSTKAGPSDLTAIAQNEVLGTYTVLFLAGPAAELAFLTQPQTTEAGGAISIEVVVLDAFGNETAASSPMVSMALASNPGGATLGGTLAASASLGIATFSNLIDVAASGYVLRATAAGLTAADSNPFDVVPGDASALHSTLTVMPFAVAADGASAVTIVVDAVNQHGIAIAGQAVQLAASGTANTLAPSSGNTDAAGQLTATWTSTVAEAKTLTATLGSLTLTATVTFYGPPCELHMPGPAYATVDHNTTAFGVGDFDGDGYIDTVDAEPGVGKIVVRRGKPDGTFLHKVDTVVAGDIRWLSVADLNGDGKLDVVAAPADASVATILLGNGDATFAAPTTRALGSVASSLALADFNNDGKLDLAAALASANQIAIHLGAGNGSFGGASATIATPHGGPTWLNAGDLNNDGRQDVVVSNSDLSMSAFLATGTLTFGPEVYTYDYGKLLLRDVNHDGFLDVVIAPTQGTTLHVRVGNGTGNFVLSQYLDTSTQNPSVAVADFNGDTHLDIVLASRPRFVVVNGVGDGTFIPGPVYSSNGFTTYGGLGGGAAAVDVDSDGDMDVVLAGPAIGTARNTGNGRFALPVIAAPEKMVIQDVGDFNGDGRPDLFAHHGDSLSGAALLSSATATWTRIANTVQPSQSAPGAIADINEDGKQDVVLFDSPSFVARLLLGTGTGAFQTGGTVATSYAENGALEDVNQDGHVDMLVISSVSRSLWVLLGTGQGTFGPPAQHALGSDAVSLEVADVDADTDRDLIVGARGGVSIFLNNGSGVFTAGAVYPAMTNLTSMGAGDFNGDGRIDIAYTDPRIVHVLLGQANGSFVAHAQTHSLTAYPYFEIGQLDAADLDGSGTQDLVIDSSMGFFVVQGLGDGTFAAAVNLGFGGYSGLDNGSPFVLADLDGDTRLDLAYSNYGGAAVALQGVCVP